MIKNQSKNYKQLESLDYSSTDHLSDLHRVVGMPKIVTEKIEGRLIQKVVFEETPVEKMNEGLSVDDFALENLLANGFVPDRSHPIGVSVDHLSEIDKVTESAEKLVVSKRKVSNPK